MNYIIAVIGLVLINYLFFFEWILWIWPINSFLKINKGNKNRDLKENYKLNIKEIKEYIQYNNISKDSLIKKLYTEINKEENIISISELEIFLKKIDLI